MLDKIWDFIIRARTWVLGALAIAVEIAPEVLGSSDFLAAVPENWRHVIVVGLLVWSRWRFATRSADAEVQVKKAINKADGPVRVEVKEAGKTKAAIHA